jgi:tetratricopeptide (TPR) repeat protein
MSSGMDDDRRLFAIRYYYINELYDDIDANVSIFEEPYQNHIVEAMLMNELGQTYRKLGQLERSAQYYRRSLKEGIEYGGTLDETIYTRLNLSRILTLQCRHEEARQLLDEALD